MTLTYPYAKASFADLLKIKSATFIPSYGQEYSGQGSGVIIAKDLRPALWTADVETVELKWDDAADIQALLEGLSGSIQTFYLYNPMRPKPRNGTVNDASCQINTLNVNGISLSLKGLPAGAVVSRGDMLSFSYGSRPSIALHRCLETVTANGSGITPEFQVGNGIRTGAVVNTAVVLNKAYGEFRMMSPFSMTAPSTYTVTYSFKCIQVI
jgi:hypothetical protein